MTATLTSGIDLAEILFTLFWVFFAALIFYLRREDKREGYPLDSDRRGGVKVQGFPAVPRPKSFKLPHGGKVVAPRAEGADLRPVAANAVAPHPGAPLVPTGDPMVDGVGPASYAQRADVPELTYDGEPRIVPMRIAPDFSVAHQDADPRGMAVLAADGETVGSVIDAWVDRSEPQIYFLEVQLNESLGGRSVLLPFPFADVKKSRREIRVDALYPHQFRNIPSLRTPNNITTLEEDKIQAYYAGGLFYADAARQEPLL